LGCNISQKSVFARKNYFYPDLPKGYQISQHDCPICEGGSVSFQVNGTAKTVSITRAHMEEDAGKSIHHGDCTLINYNRAGIPLLEIVSGPDMNNPAEAAEYCRTVRQIVRYLGVCDGNMEEGSMRCDCNVSVRKKGQSVLGTKVEIKNVNSFRFVEKAIEYEIERQIETLERGDKIIQETRLWDPDKNRTFSMRVKEDVQDYRYFPEPDLLPVILSPQYIEEIRVSLPELPANRRERFKSLYGLSDHDAALLTSEREIADYFEETTKASKNAKASANWIMSELLRELNSNNKQIQDSPLKPSELGALITLIDDGTISGKIAKTVFQEMWSTGKPAQEIVKHKGLVQITDEKAIEALVDQVLSENAQQVAAHKTGVKKNLFGYFVGAVMKASKGQANPELVNKILQEKLKT
jgi:aspartyl-tRNA(Asn)/glutamyl-tRNA(Gln) amidotransferase subunit B